MHPLLTCLAHFGSAECCPPGWSPRTHSDLFHLAVFAHALLVPRVLIFIVLAMPEPIPWAAANRMRDVRRLHPAHSLG